jgi:hypothetical protein
MLQDKTPDAFVQDICGLEPSHPLFTDLVNVVAAART